MSYVSDITSVKLRHTTILRGGGGLGPVVGAKASKHYTFLNTLKRVHNFTQISPSKQFKYRNSHFLDWTIGCPNWTRLDCKGAQIENLDSPQAQSAISMALLVTSVRY